MFRLLVLFLTAMSVPGAEDGWAKVRQIKSGAELRVFKKNAKQPVLAKMDEANDESLIVVLKNAQVAIPRDGIDRVDARPIERGSRVKTESQATTEATPTGKDSRSNPNRPSSSAGGSKSLVSKPDFETVYRRK